MMKYTTRARQGFLTILLMLTSGLCTGCMAPGGLMHAPDKPADMADSWAATSYMMVSQIVLRPDGCGTLVVTSRNSAPEVYQISSWKLCAKKKLKKGEQDMLRKLDVEVEPIGEARELVVSGWAGRSKIFIKLNQLKYGSRQLIFYRKDEVDADRRKTDAAIKAHEQ